SDGRRYHISQSRSQVRDSDILGSGEGRWPQNDCAVFIACLAVAAWRSAQAVRCHLRPGSQRVKRFEIAEALLVDRFVNDRDAMGLCQQDRERLLPIRGEARVYVGLDNGRVQFPVAKEPDAVSTLQLDPAAYLVEVGEEIPQSIWANAVYCNIAIRCAG